MEESKRVDGGRWLNRDFTVLTEMKDLFFARSLECVRSGLFLAFCMTQAAKNGSYLRINA